MKCIYNGIFLHWLNAFFCSKSWAGGGGGSNVKYFSKGKFEGEIDLLLHTFYNQTES